MNAQPSYDVTAYGESMLRLSVEHGQYLVGANSLDLNVGGAESNVCAALAQLGYRSAWFSALPRSPLSKIVTSRLQQLGVDTKGALEVESGRLGVYYLESAHPPLPTTVVYDRQYSSFSQHEVTNEQVAGLLDTRVLHLTGITAALGSKPRSSLRRLAAEARDRGVAVSFDVNYRERLWSLAEARTVLSEMLQQANILFCSQRDAVRLFGSKADGASALQTLRAETPAELIVVSAGELGAYADHAGEQLHVPAVPTSIVDRPGAGDALAGSVLHGLLSGSVVQGLQLGVALAAIVLSHHGDTAFVDRSSLEAAALRRDVEIAR